MILELRINGIAQQMGSKRAFIPRGWTRPVITDSNRNLKSWQQLVAQAAHEAIEALPATERTLLVDAVTLTVAFALPRPKALGQRSKPHVTSPDLDKLVRSVGDALTGIAYRDDSQIVDLRATKMYAAPGDVPHIDVRVEPTSAGVVPLERQHALFALGL